jgi:hypothetical protein
MSTKKFHDIYKERILCKQKLDARTKITYDQCQSNDNNISKTNNVKMCKQKKVLYELKFPLVLYLT